MLNKIITNDSWDFGVEPVAQVKVARSGRLSGSDRDDLLKNRGAAEQFGVLFDRHKVAADEIPLHTIAIGASEVWGPNRNADAFDSDTCKKQAHTFVSKPLSEWDAEEHNGARYYLDHKNQNPFRSYGYVKEAVWNDKMSRIELLVIANREKSAAKRNGGLVLPDFLQEKFAKGDPIAGSMGTTLPFDVCSICGNQAPTKADYCDHLTCKSASGLRGLGCKTGLGKITKHGSLQFLYNPNARFFDWSTVVRPADRTAFGMVADYMKAAADGGLSGAGLAECFGLFDPASSQDHVLRQTVLKLALKESEVEDNPGAASEFAAGWMLDPVQVAQSLPENASRHGRALLKAAADRGCWVPLSQFLSFIDSPFQNNWQKVAAALPGVYQRLLDDESFPAAYHPSFLSSQTVCTPAHQGWADTIHGAIHKTATDVRDQARRLVIENRKPTRVAADPQNTDIASVDRAAKAYAAYKAAVISRSSDSRLTDQKLVLAAVENHWLLPTA